MGAAELVEHLSAAALAQPGSRVPTLAETRGFSRALGGNPKTRLK